MDTKNEKDNNVILLIVIAIATMVIVVVGATFAYLGSVVENEASANINGHVGDAGDLFQFDSGDNLTLNVTQDNFGVNMTDPFDSTEISVSLTTGKEKVTHEYEISLNVEENNFEYTSGKCYLKNNAQKENTYNTFASCVGSNKAWGISYEDETYACYDLENSELANLNGLDNSEISCMTQANTVWVKEQVPELVLDLYAKNDALTEDECIGGAGTSSKGVCVKYDGTIDSSIKSESSCTSNGMWVANIYENNKCYNLIKRVDITEKAPKDKVTVLDNGTIATTKDKNSTNYYIAGIRMVNLNHNQNVNTEKSFKGSITIAAKNIEAK